MLLADDWIDRQVKHKVASSLECPAMRTILNGTTGVNFGLPDIALPGSHFGNGSVTTRGARHLTNLNIAE